MRAATRLHSREQRQAPRRLASHCPAAPEKPALSKQGMPCFDMRPRAANSAALARTVLLQRAAQRRGYLSCRGRKELPRGHKMWRPSRLRARARSSCGTGWCALHCKCWLYRASWAQGLFLFCVHVLPIRCRRKSFRQALVFRQVLVFAGGLRPSIELRRYQIGTCLPYVHFTSFSLPLFYILYISFSLSLFYILYVLFLTPVRYNIQHIIFYIRSVTSPPSKSI